MLALTNLTTKSLKTRRTSHGSAIAEFGPALLFLLLFIFLPLLDIIGLGISYSACLTLNQAQIREAAFSTREKAEDPAGAVKKGLPDKWSSTGIGVFVAPVEAPETTVSFRRVDGLSQEIVRVTTAVAVKPFLALPFFAGVPGLGAPVRYVISSERLIENTAAKS